MGWFSWHALVMDLSRSINPRYVFTCHAVNGKGSDKISKNSSSILLLFCLITLPKNELDFMPKSSTMYMAKFKHIPQSIEVEWLHSCMATIGIMIMIQSAQSDPSIMQAIYNLSPTILYWLWSWAVRVWFLMRKCLMHLFVRRKSLPRSVIVDNVSKHWCHQDCKLLTLFSEIFSLYVTVLHKTLNIEVHNQFEYSLFRLCSFFLPNVLDFAGRIRLLSGTEFCSRDQIHFQTRPR